MLQSLELMPDEAGAAAVRRDWQLLRDAGLRSQLDHRGATHAPHVTAVAVPTVDKEARALAVELIAPLLPVECTLSGLVVLGVRRRVLARVVEVPDQLVEAVLRIKAATVGHPFSGWLPHATVAHGLDVTGVARAMDVVDTSPSPFVLASVRHWDPVTATVETLTTGSV